MNPVQRLLSNTTLAFVTRIVAKFSDVLLFIIVARYLGPDDAGIFRLGKTYLALALAFSALGLDELLVREIAPRYHDSNRYLINFLVLRLLLALISYGMLAAAVLSLPITPTAQASAVILIYSLALFTESAFFVLETIFTAYERLLAPTIAAAISGSIKLIGGVIVLSITQDIVATTWVIPIGSVVSLLVLIPAIIRLYRRYPQQQAARVDWRFSLAQLKQMPGFMMIGIFYNLNAQQDMILISIFLTETQLGYYGAAQAILMGALMLSAAVRTAVYPIMSRYHNRNPEKLPHLYYKLYQYLIIGILPVTLLISLLAGSIITLIFTDRYAPAGVALQIMIWELLFTFLHIPNARLMLVNNRQKQLGWITGCSMVLNLTLNVWLLPLYGLNSAALIRVFTAFFAFLITHFYVRKEFLRHNLGILLVRPLAAAIAMMIIVWPLRHAVILWPLLVGGMAYFGLILLLGAFTHEDRYYLRQLLTRQQPSNNE
jgi:O-antigen/teichoic acid export membrane protein